MIISKVKITTLKSKRVHVNLKFINDDVYIAVETSQ